MRSVGAVVALCLPAFSCDSKSQTAPEVGAVEILLQPNLGLPRFDIRATFKADVDPGPHVQPVTAALVVARGSCFVKDAPVKPELAARLSLDVRAKRLHAVARDSRGTCLAGAMDGKAIDDPIDYDAELVVSVAR
jgi:hypothetical protein